MRKKWDSWVLPTPPSNDCTTSQKQSWFMDCDMALGVDYLEGGIFGDYFLHNPKTFGLVLSTVRQTLYDDAMTSRSPMDHRQALLVENISKGHPYESLCEYLYSFSAAAWPLIKFDRDFAKWAIKQADKWEMSTSMLLGGCLNLVAISVHPDLNK
jgi:hypothetical protein